MRSFIATLTLVLHAVAAATNASLEPRQGTSSLSGVKCGRAVYTKRQVDAAIAEGCRLHAAGDQLGSNGYPHRFNNRERLVLAASGPYQEFPILNSGIVYSGGAPGADRVVFNANLNGACVYVGAMTHTGASGNNFVSCTETLANGFGGSTATTSRPSASSTSRTATSSATPTSATNRNGAERLAGLGGAGVAAGAVAGLLML